MTIALSGIPTSGMWPGVGSDIQASLTTPGASLIVAAVTFVSSSAVTVTSVNGSGGSPSGGLPGGASFSKRGSFSFTDHLGKIRRTEVWYAISSAALTSKNINFNLSGSITSGFGIAFGVTGYDANHIWDTNSALPGTRSSTTGGVPTAPFSTDARENTLAFAIANTDNTTDIVAGALGTTTGTLLDVEADNSGRDYAFEYAIQTGVQTSPSSGLYTTFGGGSSGTVTNDYGVYVDAIRQDPITETATSVMTRLSGISQSATGNVAQVFGKITTALSGISQDVEAEATVIGSITTTLAGIGQSAEAEEIITGSIATKLGNNLSY